MKSKFKRILYGGDYNPNQWPEEIWAEDMRISAMHISTVQPSTFSHGPKFSRLRMSMISAALTR